MRPVLLRKRRPAPRSSKRKMIEQLRVLLSAISFLSIVPTGQANSFSAERLARSAAYFPLVGLMIGATGVGLALILDGLLSSQAANALIVLFLVVVSGGLHLDGLADTVDGFLGGHTRARRLEIMRQGASGPFGVAAVTLALLLKYALLNVLTGDPRLIAILLVPALARWPMSALAWALAPARSSGLGRIFAGGTRGSDALIATCFTLGLILTVSVLVSPLYLLTAVLLLFIVAVSARQSRKRIGGITGDILGATVEISEVLLFLAFALMSSSSI
jgi:adenosylcobinamide-GDP ribazoletransferase